MIWKITFMVDYPYSDYVLINADTEEEAWMEYEKSGRQRNETTFIENYWESLILK